MGFYKGKGFLFCLCFWFFLTACAQKKEIKTEDIMNEPNIQKVVNTYKEIKTYAYNPVYILHMNRAAGFSFELLVNDRLFYKRYESGTLTGSMPLYNVILKSGKQKIKIRMFPPVDDNYDMKSLIEPKKTGLVFRIVYGDEKRDKADDFTEVFNYTLPKFEQPLPYYEIDLEFEAKVPYELEGWSKGQDLAKMDKKTLEDRVVKHYEKLKALLNAGKAEEWMKLTHKRSEETRVFDYNMDNEEIHESNKKAVLNEYKNNMLPLEDYEMKIYGDGKLVTLERNATKEFQGYKENIKGWSPLMSNDGGLITNIPVKLYLPEGSNEFVIIRK